ncbi:hypothetical protein C2E23DRAFT_890716 [Lenzites betulinus]|nr:hypothetical protein C2E23DRAFT_890716 [Lenzites betulinus]
MQNPSSYYAVPKCEGRVWSGWQQSEQSGSSSRASSSTMTLKDVPVCLCAQHSTPNTNDATEEQLYLSPFDDPSNCSAIPISYTLTPPTPDATDSDVSSSSQLSMESIPEYDDMPEIPFVSAGVAYTDDWTPSDRPAEPRHVDDPCASSSFWSNIIGRSSSKSSTATSASSAVLGHTSARDVSPARTSRKRSGSVSSIASSRTKPAPAKSILSSADSVKTRRRKAPSVKFLDMPTIHYDDDDYTYDEDEDVDEQGRRRGTSTSSSSPPPKKKAKVLGELLSFRWLFGPLSKVENRTTAPARPAISGPYPIWDAPSRRARGAATGNGSGAASLRSAKSSGSLRSVRSCGSRLPTYWPR